MGARPPGPAKGSFALLIGPANRPTHSHLRSICRVQSTVRLILQLTLELKRLDARIAECGSPRSTSLNVAVSSTHI